MAALNGAELSRAASDAPGSPGTLPASHWWPVGLSLWPKTPTRTGRPLLANEAPVTQAQPRRKNASPRQRNQKQPGNSLKAQPNPDSNPRPRVLHLPPPHNLTKPSFTPSTPPDRPLSPRPQSLRALARHFVRAYTGPRHHFL
ncbi:hypothetical protein MRS44_007862 [Fusarium solani]|uniref:uncharacterized protein n=1 Tax=Fusarium solani TaxID=169388 RepID=UPI0032C4561A|nr:hypothetical protein MRS44_007862 [Fusarium solani]